MGLSQLDGIGHLLHQLPGQDLQRLKDGAGTHLKQTEMCFDGDVFRKTITIAHTAFLAT